MMEINPISRMIIHFCVRCNQRCVSPGHRLTPTVENDGILMTVVFPMTGHDGGPPFALTVNLIRDLPTTWV